MWVRAVSGESGDGKRHALLCVENGNLLSLLRASCSGKVQSHAHMSRLLTNTEQHGNRAAGPPPPPSRWSRSAAVERISLQEGEKKTTHTHTKSMKGDGDLASNSKVGYPG